MTLREWIRRPRLPQQSDYTSQLHSPRVAARIGPWLGITFSLCFVTGLLSHYIQHPPAWFGWPTRPVWLYRLTQGVHVASGIAAIPLLFIKLWVVTPRFWRRPLLTGLLNILERGSILILIASAAFELISGLLNVAEFYPWAFFFPPVHYAVAWIVIGALLVHIAVKLPVIRTALSRPVGDPDPVDVDDAALPAAAPPAGSSSRASAILEPLAAQHPFEPAEYVDRGVAAAPSAPGPVHKDPRRPGSLSRRSLLGVAAGAAGAVTIATIGDRIPALDKISVLAQRNGNGPQGLPVNRSAQAAGVLRSAADPGWRLTVNGPAGAVAFSLAQLHRMPQHTADLPIACVEGWARDASWSGVRLSDLLTAAGAASGSAARVTSLDHGLYGRSDVPASVCQDPLTLVALMLNGQQLHPDHGYPARLIAPARPGVLQTKWLSRIDVTA